MVELSPGWRAESDARPRERGWPGECREHGCGSVVKYHDAAMSKRVEQHPVSRNERYLDDLSPTDPGCAGDRWRRFQVEHGRVSVYLAGTVLAAVEQVPVTVKIDTGTYDSPMPGAEVIHGWAILLMFCGRAV
jgi:hypothetical protein